MQAQKVLLLRWKMLCVGQVIIRAEFEGIHGFEPFFLVVHSK